MIDVLHRKHFEPLLMLSSSCLLLKEDYIKIATVDADTLGYVWTNTQNNLTKNKYIKYHVTADIRPSYIGDIFVQKEKMFIVLAVGYKEVSWGDVVTFLNF